MITSDSSHYKCIFSSPCTVKCVWLIVVANTIYPAYSSTSSSNDAILDKCLSDEKINDIHKDALHEAHLSFNSMHSMHFGFCEMHSIAWTYCSISDI